MPSSNENGELVFLNFVFGEALMFNFQNTEELNLLRFRGHSPDFRHLLHIVCWTYVS